MHAQEDWPFWTVECSATCATHRHSTGKDFLPTPLEKVGDDVELREA